MDIESPRLVNLKKSNVLFYRFIAKQLNRQRNHPALKHDEKFRNLLVRLNKIQSVRITHSVKDEKFTYHIKDSNTFFNCFYCSRIGLKHIFKEISRFVIHVMFTHSDLRVACRITQDFKLNIDSIRVQSSLDKSLDSFYQEKTTPRNFKYLFLEPLKKSFPEELSK